MNEWDKLSMAEKARYIKMAVQSGIYDLSTIKSSYNKFQSGGETNDISNDKSDFFHNIKSKASEILMNLIWESQGRREPNITRSFKHSMIPDKLTRSGGVAQRTYLLNRDDQEKEFLDAGYIKGEKGDYGLVKKAVGDRDLPIYQREPDSTSRDNLVPIGNISDTYLSDKGELIHAGSYPTAIYYDSINDKFYQKAWDLNDYSLIGDSKGASSRYTGVKKVASKFLDLVGSPVVVTSGIQEIPSDADFSIPLMMRDYLDNKGLKYSDLGLLKEKTLLNINGDSIGTYKGSYMTPHLPEVIITGTKK